MRYFKKAVIAVISLAFLAAFLGACGSTNTQVIDAAHNSRNSLSWAGVYTGMIPAADGPGIDVWITLRYDETYELKSHYIDKEDADFTDTGTFTWDQTGSIVTLNDARFAANWKVGENTLTMLDSEGKLITDTLFADMYVLKKTGD
jgi:uncharacterized lipoprotein NlpE involved in copper resistance